MSEFHKTCTHLRNTQKKKKKENNTRWGANRRTWWQGGEEREEIRGKRNLKIAALESTMKRHPPHYYGRILQNFCAQFAKGLESEALSSRKRLWD